MSFNMKEFRRSVKAKFRNAAGLGNDVLQTMVAEAIEEAVEKRVLDGKMTTLELGGFTSDLLDAFPPMTYTVLLPGAGAALTSLASRQAGGSNPNLFQAAAMRAVGSMMVGLARGKVLRMEEAKRSNVRLGTSFFRASFKDQADQLGFTQGDAMKDPVAEQRDTLVEALAEHNKFEENGLLYRLMRTRRAELTEKPTQSWTLESAVQRGSLIMPQAVQAMPELTQAEIDATHAAIDKRDEVHAYMRRRHSINTLDDLRRRRRTLYDEYMAAERQNNKIWRRYDAYVAAVYDLGVSNMNAWTRGMFMVVDTIDDALTFEDRERLRAWFRDGRGGALAALRTIWSATSRHSGGLLNQMWLYLRIGVLGLITYLSSVAAAAGVFAGTYILVAVLLLLNVLNVLPLGSPLWYLMMLFAMNVAVYFTRLLFVAPTKMLDNITNLFSGRYVPGGVIGTSIIAPAISGLRGLGFESLPKPYTREELEALRNGVDRRDTGWLHKTATAVAIVANGVNIAVFALGFVFAPMVFALRGMTFLRAYNLFAYYPLASCAMVLSGIMIFNDFFSRTKFLYTRDEEKTLASKFRKTLEQNFVQRGITALIVVIAVFAAGGLVVGIPVTLAVNYMPQSTIASTHSSPGTTFPTSARTYEPVAEAPQDADDLCAMQRLREEWGVDGPTHSFCN